jgi:DNA transformation protein and related proteins
MPAAPKDEFALELADHMDSVPGVFTRRFFGGTAFVSEGVQFAFMFDGSLYFRVDDESRAQYLARGAKPFTYQGKSKTVNVASYFEAPSDIIEDPELLSGWAGAAYRAALGAKLKSPSARTNPRAKGRKADRRRPTRRR